MNAYDRSNLDFLLAIDKPTLKDWYKKTSKQDRKYASYLLDAYALELAERSLAIEIDEKIESLGENLASANKVLNKIKKKK